MGLSYCLTDGDNSDDHVPSSTNFPFLAPPLATSTSGAIAIENLDYQIAQRGDESGVEELLLIRSRFLGDYEARDRAARISESRGDVALRARVRAALHRF